MLVKKHTLLHLVSGWYEEQFQHNRLQEHNETHHIYLPKRPMETHILPIGFRS